MSELILATMMSQQKSQDFERDPLTSEEYMKLDGASKFSLTFKWALEEFNTGIKNLVTSKLERFSKPLDKQKYVVYNRKNGQVMKEYENKLELINDLNIKELEFKYILKYNNPNNPKYESWHKYKIKRNNYILKGDNYILELNECN